MEEIKKAKLRALNILTRMDKTESDLRAGLKRAGFSENAVDAAIEYVKSYGYVNDQKYAEKYVVYNKDRKSRQKIKYELQSKGVSKEYIEYALENCEDFDEREVLRSMLYKKWKPDKYSGEKSEKKPDEKTLKKLYAALARQGFSSCDIWQVFHEENLT